MPDPLAEELDRAVSGERRDVLPLEYAGKRERHHPPIDWPATIRQIVFALAIGLCTYTAIDIWADHYDAWRRNGEFWMSFGATIVALTLNWPGRIGRRK